MITKPNPGSPEAIAQGCICARMDNHNGNGSGYTGEDGKPLFYVTVGCPLHSPEEIRARFEARARKWMEDPEVQAVMRKNREEVMRKKAERRAAAELAKAEAQR